MSTITLAHKDYVTKICNSDFEMFRNKMILIFLF